MWPDDNDSNILLLSELSFCASEAPSAWAWYGVEESELRVGLPADVRCGERGSTGASRVKSESDPVL